MRKKRLDDRFRQKVASVLDDFDNLVKTLTAEMMSSLDPGSSIFIEEIAIVFGATPVCVRLKIRSKVAILIECLLNVICFHFNIALSE